MMNWLLIDKSRTAQPSQGTYKDWKQILQREGGYQCVYCAIGESRFGGFRNFHVEHYRPKKKFPKLENSISNLFYICAICNSFKGSDWPNEPSSDFSNACYPDPSVHNYSDLLAVDDNSVVISQRSSGKYVIERLYLNRLQLVHARALDRVLANILELKAEISAQLSRADAEMKGRLAEMLLSAIELLARLQYVRPYEPDEIRR